MQRSTSYHPIDNPVWSAWKNEVIESAQAHAVQIIGTLTDLHEESHGNWKGLSPYRKERTPSFYVYADGLCHDYGTGETKDVVGCVMQSRSCDFREGLDYAATCTGIDKWEERKARKNIAGLDDDQLAELRKWQGEERRIQELMTMIVEVCARMLPSRVREFLKTNYGLDEETIVRERIGWIPAGLFEIMQEYAPWVDDDMWLATGFFYSPKGGGKITTSRAQRILFAYWRNGLCVYTIARLHEREGVVLLDWEKGKYQKHATYDADKRPYVSKTISNKWQWGEDIFKGPMDRLLLNEGVVDAMMLKQFGYPVISPVTTTMREEDYDRVLPMVRRFLTKIGKFIVINDADVLEDGTEPGLKGATKTARLAWLAGIRSLIGQLPRPEGVRKIDVCDFLRDKAKEGGEDFARAQMDAILDAALPYPYFLLSRIPKDTKAADLAPHLPVLAEAMVPMDVLSRADFERAIGKKFLGLKAIIKQELRKSLDTATEKAAGGIVAGMTSRAEGEGAEPSDNKKHRARHEGLRGAVTVNPLGYYERGGTGQEQVSTFVLVPIRRSLREDGMLELVVRVEAPDESVMAVVGGRETIVTEWLVPHKAWGSAREFIRALPTARIQWTGGDHEVQGLLATLTDTAKLESLPLTRSTPVVGRHNASDGTPRFVLVAGTLSKDGWMTEPDVIYRVSGSPADRMLSREQSAVGGPGVEVLAREVIPMMLDLHDREITQPTVAWLFACVFAPVFRERLGGFPFLNPWGEQGSGKSSLIIHGLARLFYKSPEPISVKSTPFALISLFAHLNALPALFDEYKEADMGKFVDGFRRRLRANYSGETETRGHQDLTVSSYANTAPVLLCGEQKVEGDPALGERGTFAPFRKRYLHEHPEAKVALDRWRELPVHLLGPSYLCWSLSADFEGMLAEARADCRAVFDKMNLRTIPSRIELNVVMSLFGLIAGERWAQTLGTTFGEIDATEHVASVLRNALGDDVVRTGDVSPLNAVDHFVEDAAELIEQGLAIEGIHWTRTGGLGGKWCTASS